MKCPACSCDEPSNDHLITEYFDLMKAGMNPVFGHNARLANNAVADLLISRGITEIPNIFGALKVGYWKHV
jgi:hypothetical protein